MANQIQDSWPNIISPELSIYLIKGDIYFLMNNHIDIDIPQPEIICNCSIWQMCHELALMQYRYMFFPAMYS